MAYCDKSFSLTQALSSTTGGDAQLYRAIVNRVHDGQNYYQVVGSELRARDYATRPFFNWRLPLLAWFTAKMPTLKIANWILISLTLATFIMWLLTLSKEDGFYATLLGGFLLLGTVVAAFTNVAFLFHEMWAGVLIAFSIVLYARNRSLSVISGLLALFIRELTLPFAVVMMIMAYREHHRRQAIAWLIGIAAFFVYLSIHARTVLPLLTDSDPTNQTWIQLGGWSFVLTTTKWTLLTFLTPIWIDVVLLPLALLGAAGWRSAVGTRLALTIAAYIFAFSIVGRPDNYYWGLLYAPLLPLALLHAPRSFVDLCKVAVGTKKQSICQ